MCIRDRRLLRYVALQALGPQVHQHEVVVGAAGDDVEAVGAQRFRKRLSVFDDVLRVDLEVRPQRFRERHRLGGDHMHQRPALQAREDRRIQLLGDDLVVGQDQAAARTAQRLVGGGGGDVGIGHRRGMHAARDQTREVRHVDQEVRPDAVGDLAEPLEVPGPRIGRAAGDDQLRPDFLGLLRHGVHVDDLVLAPHRVVHRLEPFAGHVDGRAVGEMATGREIEAHEGVAGLQQRQEHGLVHLAAGVRLHVGEVGAEQLLGAIDGEVFRDVDEFAAAIIARARIAFRILVGHHRALRLQHGAADDVFRRDQLDFMPLATEFALDGGGDLRIGLGKRRREKRLGDRGIGGGLGGRAHGRKYLHRRSPLGRRERLQVWSEAVGARYHIWSGWPSSGVASLALYQIWRF